MYPSNYDKGFMQGVTIRNIPIEIAQTGQTNVWWVDSVHGSNGNQGNFLHPLASLSYALVNKVKQGDKVFIAEGHTEYVIVAGGLLFNVAGITVQFLGEGATRGTISFINSAAASMSITAAGVTLINPRFTAGIDALSSPINIAAADCTILNGEWYDGTTIDTTDCIVATTAATRLSIDGWKYFKGTEAGTQKNSQIKMTQVAAASLKNIDIAGNFLVANINNATTACTDLRLEHVVLKNTNATPKPGMVIQAATTGQAKEVDIRIASGSTYVSSVAAMNWDANCLGYAIDGATGDPIGTAAAGTMEGTIDTINTNIGDPSGDTLTSITAKLGDGATTVTADLGTLKTSIGDPSGDTLTSITAKLGDGSTTVTADLSTLKTNLGDASGDALTSVVAKLGNGATTVTADLSTLKQNTGTYFILKKTLISSDIVQAGIDITDVSTVGELLIDQVIFKTDGVGLATGTNVQIGCNNVKGASIFAAEAVASLGASTTVSTPSVINVKTVLETGKKLTVYSTAADCTGAGTVDIYIRFQRLVPGAFILAM